MRLHLAEHSEEYSPHFDCDFNSKFVFDKRQQFADILHL